MKKALLILLLLIIAGASVYMLLPEKAETDYIRIHIRANSNSEDDQSVKYLIRDRVVAYLVPLLADCGTAEKAKRILDKNKDKITALADAELYNNGFKYKADALLKRETFPARKYGDLSLAAGTYDALIINLGEAKGDNWWCVAFPPLCFIPSEDSEEIIYKSKIMEIIKRFEDKKNG